MVNDFFDSGLSLEEAFFRKKDAELIALQCKLEAVKQTRQALSDISGIHNPKVLDKLIELEISPNILASMAIVPLVEVAWADGTIDDKERAAVLEAADANGIKSGSCVYLLLQNWLQHKPPARLLEAWLHYIEGVCETMTPAERHSLRSDLLDRARKVAGSSGGILGVALKISPAERSVLKKMEHAFS